MLNIQVQLSGIVIFIIPLLVIIAYFHEKWQFKRMMNKATTSAYYKILVADSTD